MSAERDALLAHLEGAVTTVCRAWAVERADGMRLGFTDHDRDLAFDGWDFCADSGLGEGDLAQPSRLCVANMDAVGVI